MPSRRRATTIGSGASEFVASHREGGVVGVFRHGFYVGSGTKVMAIVGPSISPGPLNITLQAEPEPPNHGTPVIVGPTLELGEWQIETADAKRYAPTIPSRVGRARLLAEIDVPVSIDLQPIWSVVVQCVAGGDLARARDLLCGRGQGLTPEGDDVLAAILLVACGEESFRSILPGLVAEARTTNLSRAFLAWAARGESVAAIHDLLWAAARDDRSAFDLAQRQVARLGGSTGLAMLAGIALAASLGTA